MTGKEFEWLPEGETCIDLIQNDEMRRLTRDILLQYGTEEKFYEAEDVVDVLMAMLKKKKQISSSTTPAWIDLLIVAGLLHNLFYDGTLQSIFKARELLAPVMKEKQIPINAISAIFQTIESQLGTDMPVENCQPQGDTPNALFAWACWFVEEYEDNKRMPQCRLLGE